MPKISPENGSKPIVRGKRGLFQKGTRGGPGRPPSYRAAVEAELTPETVGKVLRRLVGLAIKAGSIPAAREVLLRALGQPDRGLDPDPAGLATEELIARVLEHLAHTPEGRAALERALEQTRPAAEEGPNHDR